MSTTAIAAVSEQIARARAAEPQRLVRQLLRLGRREVDEWLEHWPYSEAEKRMAEVALGRRGGTPASLATASGATCQMYEADIQADLEYGRG